MTGLSSWDEKDGGFFVKLDYRFSMIIFQASGEKRAMFF
jgi:hypothetical protein